MTKVFQNVLESIHRLGFSIEITSKPNGTLLHAICKATGEEFFSRSAPGHETQAIRDLKDMIEGRPAHVRKSRARAPK